MLGVNYHGNAMGMGILTMPTQQNGMYCMQYFAQFMSSIFVAELSRINFYSQLLTTTILFADVNKIKLFTSVNN